MLKDVQLFSDVMLPSSSSLLAPPTSGLSDAKHSPFPASSTPDCSSSESSAGVSPVQSTESSSTVCNMSGLNLY